MNEMSWLKESESLGELIKKLDIEVNTKQFYASGYSDPTSLNKKNEVWKIKKE